MIPLREYDAYISRWMGVSLETETRKNLLPDYDWEVNPYANENGFVIRITVDIGRNGRIDEEWSTFGDKIIRTTMPDNDKFIYTPDGWKSN